MLIRPSLRFLLLPFVLAVGSGCSAKVEDEVTALPGSPPSITPTDVCAATASTSCSASNDVPLDPRSGVIANMVVSGYPSIGIYPDGTLRRNAFDSIEIAFSRLPEPNVDLTAKLSPATLATIQADIAALAAQDYAHAYVGSYDPAFAVRLANGAEGCVTETAWHTPAKSAAECSAPSAYRALHDDFMSLYQKSEDRRAAALEGTVSFDQELFPKAWPLGAAGAVPGDHDYPADDLALIEMHSLYQVGPGIFVSVIPGIVSGQVVQAWPTVEIVAADAALSSELIANVGRYQQSGETWLGVPLLADKFPPFKSMRLGIVHSADGSADRYFEVWALEHFDLTNDGDL